MTAFKNIRFGSSFPIQIGDVVTITANDVNNVSFIVSNIIGFTLYSSTPFEIIIGSDDKIILNKVTIVDHGFKLLYINGRKFKSLTQSREIFI